MNQVRVLYMLLVLSLAGMGVWVWKTKQDQRGAEEALVRAVDLHEDRLAARQAEMERTLAEQRSQNEKSIADLKEAHDKELDDLRKDERRRVTEAFAQFSALVEGSKDTLAILDALEQKVKAGRQVTQEEAEKLAAIATGLSHLQQQYKKPFREFGELESYLSRRASATLTAPDGRFSFWKRVFSRNYREQMDEFHRSEGEKRAFQEASEKFSSAYAAAQRQMAASQVDFDKAMVQLNALVEDKGAKPDDLGDFFTKARKALSAHQKLLDFDPQPQAPLPGAGPQP